MSHAALDELAVTNHIIWEDGVTTKAEKAAVLEAAGVAAPASDEPADPVYRLRLNENFFGEKHPDSKAPDSPEPTVPSASFMAGDDAVELTADDPVFETSDRLIWLGLRELPFLTDEGEVK
jgi:hypothetical protein